YYDIRNRMFTIGWVERSELRLVNEATVNGTGQFEFFAVPNDSIVYTGVNHISGARVASAGQVIVVAESGDVTGLHLGQFISANFTFYSATGPTGHVSLIRNFTVAGFASITTSIGYGYLTGSKPSDPATVTFGPAIIADWDELAPPMLDLVISKNSEGPNVNV